MSSKSQAILIDSNNATLIQGLCTSFQAALKIYPVWIERLSQRVGFIRGVLFWWLGRKYDWLVASCDAPGLWTMMFLEALLTRKRRVVLMEFIRREPSGWRRWIYPLWYNLVVYPAVQTSMQVGVVMTRWEQDYYARMFNLPRQCFEFIPCPLASDSDQLGALNTDDPLILSAGRVACDWETLFKAARGRNWSLTVVCSRRDLPRVQRLNYDKTVRVLSEIPWSTYKEIRDRAWVFVISMLEKKGSSGQVRLADAIRGGVPIVLSRISGLDGYFVEGETALSFAPGDWQGLRDAVERLIRDTNLRDSLRSNAFEKAKQWTYQKNVVALRTLIQNACYPP